MQIHLATASQTVEKREAKGSAVAGEKSLRHSCGQLSENRGIDDALIEHCVKTGRLYESSPYHNVVFVGFDAPGTAKYATLRGIGTDFKGEANGSDKHYSFCLPAALTRFLEDHPHIRCIRRMDALAAAAEIRV